LKLRSRLALTVVLAAVPLLAAVAWLRVDLARRAEDRSLHEFAVARMESGGRERCEADPTFFALFAPPPPRLHRDFDGGPPVAPPPPPEGGPPALPDGGAPPDPPSAPPPIPLTQMWAYGPDFKSANPRAPEIPAELVARLAGGASDAGMPYEPNGLHGRQLAVRMSWGTGPCAVVYLRRIHPAGADVGSFPFWAAAGVGAGMLAVVVLAAGSIVRRIRKLTIDVRRSADDRYATPVEARGADEIAELARVFNDAGGEVRRRLDDLARREDTLRTFVANTTHDVMTPITVLQGHLSAIRSASVAGRAAPPEIVNDAVDEAHYLASLVHNLGAAAKLDAASQQVRLSPVDLNGLVDRVVARHWAVASPRAIDVEFGAPEQSVWIDADVTLLEQAVNNVVGNAVRYNRAGGHVAVLLDVVGTQEFTLRVVDDGPGVPDEQLARLTEREFRSDEARRRNPEGMGLGLDIARRVAEFHRIAMSFRRSEYGGLEVEFRGVRGTPPAAGT
jgi:signal transduction histidine kinase